MSDRASDAVQVFNAGIFIAVIVVLVLLIIGAIGWLNRFFRGEDLPQGFDTSAWKYGSVMDQGYFRPGLTPAQLSVYMPQLGGVRSELSRMMMPRRRGRRAGYCAGGDSPDAIAEAQGLAALGA